MIKLFGLHLRASTMVLMALCLLSTSWPAEVSSQLVSDELGPDSSMNPIIAIAVAQRRVELAVWIVGTYDEDDLEWDRPSPNQIMREISGGGRWHREDLVAIARSLNMDDDGNFYSSRYEQRVGAQRYMSQFNTTWDNLSPSQQAEINEYISKQVCNPGASCSLEDLNMVSFFDSYAGMEMRNFTAKLEHALERFYDHFEFDRYDFVAGGEALISAEIQRLAQEELIRQSNSNSFEEVTCTDSGGMAVVCE